MTTSFTWKHLGMWMAMLVLSVANGALRDLVYTPWMSELAAHQLSTVIAMAVLGAMIRAFMRRVPARSRVDALGIGLAWVALTVAFECLFFHYGLGHPWSALLANYDLAAGRVWVLELVWIALAPLVFFRVARRA